MFSAYKPGLRWYADARMDESSTVTVRRKTGVMIQDETNGDEIPEWATPFAGIPFRLDGSSTGDGGMRGVTVGGVTYEQATGIGHFAHDAALRDDDYVEITAGEWVGTVLRVVKVTRKDQATALRVPVEEVPRPPEWA